MAEDLKAAFDGLDKEGKGSINKDQLAEFLSKHEKEAGKGKEIAEKAFEKLGADSINFEQFSNVIQKLKERRDQEQK